MSPGPGRWSGRRSGPGPEPGEACGSVAPLPELPPGTIAVGWATVELERATRELAGLLVPGAAFADGPASVILGARTRVSGMRLQDGREIRLVLLEPDTEGRLAATLARHGEGWVATWSFVPSGWDGPRVSAARPGPFGRERIVLGGPISGPHHLLVEAATIEP